MMHALYIYIFQIHHRFTYLNYLIANNEFEHNIIRKLVPNAADLTTQGCEFNIRQANARHGETLIRESEGKAIDFEITCFIPQIDRQFFLRFMIVDPKSPESIVTCRCQNNAHHILYLRILRDSIQMKEEVS